MSDVYGMDKPISVEARAFCDWTDSWDEDYNNWRTECGHDFQFNSDGPHDWMRFCCFCGGIVTLHSTNELGRARR